MNAELPRAPIRRALTITLLAPLAVAITLAVVLAVELRGLTRAAASVDHTDRVISRINDVERRFVDEQTALRGFMLSKEDLYLEPYRRAQVDRALDALASDVVDNPTQLAHVAALRRTHARWQQGVAARVGRWPKAAEMKADKEAMDEMRGSIATMLDEENRLRASREADSSRSLRRTITASVALVLALALVVAAVTRRQIRGVIDTFEHALGREREARAAAELAARSRETFLSAASHELRTPLATLRLQVDSLALATRDTAPIARERLARKIGTMSSQVRRLERLVAALLDVTRLERGQVTLATERVDMRTIVREAVASLEDSLARAHADVVIDADGEAVVVGDRLRLDQAVTNLLANAMKFGANHPIELHVARKARSVVTTVRDHGPGVADENRARIFDRFERAVDDRHYGGLGLGLWIAREIVRAHGGRIAVAGRPGDGAEFTIELPAAP